VTSLARRMYRTLEPLHAFIYFDQGAARRYADLGVTHGHMQYFASRAAAMGAVGPGPVVATFFNFDPTVIERSLPKAWEIVSPDLLLAARNDAAADTYAVTFDGADDAAGEALELLLPAVQAVTPLMAGRPLAAAYADQPEPTEPLRRLWWAITILREWRGDGHVAALTADGMDPVEVLHTHIAAGGVNADILRVTRAWPDDRWAAARGALVARGELTADGELTEAGRARRTAVEDVTDRLAMPAWDALGDERCARIQELLKPYGKAVMEASGLGAMVRPDTADPTGR
jgi:hypothetical protein